MASYNIWWKASTKEIAIIPTASDTPEGFINIGDYTHDTENDPLGAPGSHVLFHHIQKALYPLGVQDMAYINISFKRGIESDPVIISCAYPMDASLAEIQAILPMIDAVPVMTDDFQTATYTLTGSAPAGDWEVLCAPTITPPGPATVDFSSGVKAFEWAYSIPTLTVPAAQQVVMSSILKLVYANNFSNGLIDIHIDTEISGGVQITRMQVRRLGTAVSSYIDVPNTGRISVVMDADTGTFSVISHEVGIIPLSDNSYNPATPCIFSLLFNEYYGVDPVHIGKEATVSLVTNASDMTGTYPPGTTDICGNPLAKDVSESWAIVAIEPINPAGTPVAYRVQVRK